jgi:hypothetical protein
MSLLPKQNAERAADGLGLLRVVLSASTSVATRLCQSSPLAPRLAFLRARGFRAC